MEENIITRLTEIRREKRISQKKLASLAGVSVATVQGYEQGKFCPRPYTLKRLCDALGIPVSALSDTVSTHLFNDPLETELQWIASGGETHYYTEIGRLAGAVSLFRDLNEAGQRNALDLLELVSKVPEYRIPKQGPGTES